MTPPTHLSRRAVETALLSDAEYLADLLIYAFDIHIANYIP